MPNNIEMDNFAMYICKTVKTKQNLKKDVVYVLSDMCYLLIELSFNYSASSLQLETYVIIITHVRVIFFYWHITKF